MSWHASKTSLARSRRKQDLLLASQLARGQVVLAFDELADRADRIADRVVRIRVGLSSPLGWAVGSAVGALVLAVTLRRVRAVRVLRWSWRAWRLWRSAAPAVALLRATGWAQPARALNPAGRTSP